MAYRLKSHQYPSWSLSAGSFTGIPNELSRWEKFLEAENLDETRIKKNNPRVKEFVLRHADKFYVPTKVLKMYGMSIEG